MSDVDLNLLLALDALLAEGSVTGAARRLRVSASAMSRTLARLRAATGDPLLVRAGRDLVPTGRAAALRDRVHTLSLEVQSVLRPDIGEQDLARLDRTFTIRANEGFIAGMAGRIATAVGDAAPHTRIRFVTKAEKGARELREGEADLEIGVVGEFAPEVRTQGLFRDRFVGVARTSHSLFSEPTITPERYAACRHVVASRRGAVRGPVDEALERLGLRRVTSVVVPGFPDALRIASQSDLVGLVPRSCVGADADGGEPYWAQLRWFELPVLTPEILVSVLWHPRADADPGHRWLRGIVGSVCRAEYGPHD